MKQILFHAEQAIPRPLDPVLDRRLMKLPDSPLGQILRRQHLAILDSKTLGAKRPDDLVSQIGGIDFGLRFTHKMDGAENPAFRPGRKTWRLISSRLAIVPFIP
jgi:hypothetical protein